MTEAYHYDHANSRTARPTPDIAPVAPNTVLWNSPDIPPIIIIIIIIIIMARWWSIFKPHLQSFWLYRAKIESQIYRPLFPFPLL
jgi:hypothetical protein